LQELTKDNTHLRGKYMVILEELSTNRDLQTKLKEVESMLRDMKLEELPSYQIGMERGVSQGISQGITSSAIKMITKFKLSIEEVAKELNISIDELRKHLDKP
jgi:predicted transposase YdaD